ncbi:MAG: TonB-dependent receptor [Opitutaceae bacterium]|nr:TonB-dependent receptor [Opitutaceae bacterium]
MNTTRAVDRAVNVDAAARCYARSLPRFGLTALLAFLLPTFIPSAHGQATASPATGTGVVTGRVSNAGTNAYLEGAVVTLEPGNRTALTTSTGEFVFVDMPAGVYTLTASYTGLDPTTSRIVVEPNGRATSDLQLTSTIYELERFVVAGEREGNAAAITSQRNADNVKTVMASDAFGNVADLNIGNFLMRMPGVTKTEAEGDVVGIMIRGISDDLSMVTIDGEQGASASPLGGMKRAFEVDKISADFIESIEVVKSLTPDMDAGAVGGIVNMKTKSALTRKGRHLSFQAGEAYNVWRSTLRPFASVTYSDVLGAEQKFGVLLTVSYNQTNKPRDNSNFTYEQTTATDRPVWFNANPWGEDWTNHTRIGLSTRLDYKLTPVTTLYTSLMFSDYEVTLSRHRGGLSNPTAANLVQVTDTISEARNQTFNYIQSFIHRTVKTQSYMVGGDTRLLGGKLDFQATLSPSKGHQDTFNTPRAVAGTQIRQDRSVSHNYVTITQTGGPDIFDPRNMTMNNFQLPEEELEDRVIGVQVNLVRNLETKWPLVLKTGARYRSVRKSTDETARTFSYVGPNGVVGPVGAANDDDLARFFDPTYHHKAFLYPTDRMSFFDGAKIQQAMIDTPNYFLPNVANTVQNSIANDTELTEDIASAYLMGTLKVGRFTAVGGVRFEDTRVTGSGYKNEISREEAARRAAWVGTVTPVELARRTLAQYGNPISSKSSYHNYFPSLNLKYALRPNLLARAGFSESVGRPAIGSIRPSVTANVETETLTANNPNLKPQRSRNIDLSLEYYLKSTGLVSVGAFRKDLRDFIFRSGTAVPLEPGNPFGEQYVGYDLTTSVNGGTAWVRGLEFAYQQQLSGLQLRLLRPFGFFTNFTWLETQGNYNDPSGVSGPSAVPGFTPRSGNIGLSWIAHGWTVRVKAKYESDRLRQYNANPAQRTYVNDNFPVDLNVAYTINRRLTAFVDVINVFDSRTFDDYIYIEDRPFRTFKFSTYVKAGVSGRF